MGRSPDPPTYAAIGTVRRPPQNDVSYVARPPTRNPNASALSAASAVILKIFIVFVVSSW